MPKLQSETVLRCSADNFYDTLKRNMNNLPRFLPETIKSVQVLEGDGMNMGTVRHWIYELGGSTLNVKEKTEDVDDENRSITAKVIGGDVMNLYNNFRFKVHVTPLGEDECTVKWTVGFEKVHEHIPTPNMYLNMTAMITREMAHHLS